MLQNLRPQYAKTFRCIGADCEDTCCRGWEVVIDRSAFQRLESSPRFESRVKQHLVVLKDSSEQRHARIQLTAAYTCPFLSEERLCSIQQEGGEQYLPHICATYPRVLERIDGLKETSLVLSCPEAARLVLLNPELMPRQESNLPRYHNFLREAVPVRPNGAPAQFLWVLREFVLLLLQDRSYPLWRRVFLLGMFCRRLNEITVAKQLSLVPQLLKEHCEIIADNKLGQAMDGIPVRTSLQLSVVFEILHSHLAVTDASHSRFRECVSDFLCGIRHDQGQPLDAFVLFFERAYRRYYQPFMQAHPYILENYLLNYVFRTLFPYGVNSQGKANDPLSSYFTMCVFFSVIKALLIGVSGCREKSFSTQDVVKVVQSFAKAVEQSPTFSIDPYMGMASADGMALLLKND